VPTKPKAKSQEPRASSDPDPLPPDEVLRAQALAVLAGISPEHPLWRVVKQLLQREVQLHHKAAQALYARSERDHTHPSMSTCSQRPWRPTTGSVAPGSILASTSPLGSRRTFSDSRTRATDWAWSGPARRAHRRAPEGRANQTRP